MVETTIKCSIPKVQQFVCCSYLSLHYLLLFATNFLVSSIPLGKGSVMDYNSPMGEWILEGNLLIRQFFFMTSMIKGLFGVGN